MKIKFKVFIIVGVIGVLFFALFQDDFYRYRMMSRYNITKEHFEEIDEKDKVALNSTGSLLKDIVVCELGNKKTSLKKMSNGHKIVIVNFSNSKCFYCIEDILFFINKYKKEINLENVVLLGSFQNQRDHMMFKRGNNINFKIYNIYNQKLELYVETLNHPYIIITDSFLKIKSVFIPAKELPKRTDDYFRFCIKKRLFEEIK